MEALQFAKGAAKGTDVKALAEAKAKLKLLEGKLAAVHKKLSGHARLERLKAQSEECAKRLAGDICSMKKARVRWRKITPRPSTGFGGQ